VTTVSPTYARETLTSASGCGLEGVLGACGDRYVGILNGIDEAVWDPTTDPLLPATYSSDDLSGKRTCKRTLLERFSLPVGDDALARPVVGMVSRLVDQKGIDLVKAASPTLMGLDATWIFVGTGEERYERWLRHLAAVHPSRVGALVGFDERLAHLVEAGADLFLMPSRFEPCGLNQMYSLRYGTVPIVRKTGGLADSVRQYDPRTRAGDGILFRDYNEIALGWALNTALDLFHDQPVWHRIMQNGMAMDLSWERQGHLYVDLFRRLAGSPG